MAVWRESGAFEADRAGAGADVPDQRIGLEAQFGERQGAGFLLGDQAFFRRTLDVFEVFQPEAGRAGVRGAFDEYDVGLRKLHFGGVDRSKAGEDDFIVEQQATGNREFDLVAITGGDQRPGQPVRRVFRAGEQGDARMQRNRPHQLVEAVLRRCTNEPLAGIGAVAS